MKRRSFLALLPASITTLPAILKGQPYIYAKNTKLKTIKANFPGNTIKDGEFDIKGTIKGTGYFYTT